MIRVDHHALSLVTVFRRQVTLPSIELQMQKVAIVMLGTKRRVSKDRAKKCLVRHNHMLGVFEIVANKASRLGLSKILSKFSTDHEPLTARVQLDSGRCIL